MLWGHSLARGRNLGGTEVPPGTRGGRAPETPAFDSRCDLLCIQGGPQFQGNRTVLIPTASQHSYLVPSLHDSRQFA